MEFKAETSRLLNIVAKSIYTDKEVFLRELLSNCSDALEKQRYAEISGQSVTTQLDHQIEVTTNASERTISIYDSGIGMSREEIIENLGTIAKSSSETFRNFVDADAQSPDSSTADNIIGQFGVGFYSSFIVADLVEVYSKSIDGKSGVKWSSDGTGDYEIANISNLEFERGTKIVLRLKSDCSQFSKEGEVDKVIKKYSIFNKYPIKLNGELINKQQAIWYMDKREVSQDQYEIFYETLANTKIPYKYKLHYSTDVPIAIKALFYIPNNHAEKMQMLQEEQKMHLYCRKVLIKESCQELIPRYLRFVKGIVDCEDLPLNISRESYQDSTLISKLRNVVTRRILKFMEDEMKRDAAGYDKWYQEFQSFLKEGVLSDNENKEQLLRLMRYFSTGNQCSGTVSLEEYLKSMKKDQKKIYFLSQLDASGISAEKVMSNPFMEPFKDSDIPVLVVGNQVDEMVFQQIGAFKGYSFVNVESGYEEIAKDLGDRDVGSSESDLRIPEEDITPFCLWLKEMTKPYVGKVTLSRRLKGVPCVLFGQVSSNMRVMMQMMQEQADDPAEAARQLEAISHNQTLEINPQHPIIVKLNELRKVDESRATKVSKTMLDDVLMRSAIPNNMQEAAGRNLEILDDYLAIKVQKMAQ